MLVLPYVFYTSDHYLVICMDERSYELKSRSGSVQRFLSRRRLRDSVCDCRSLSRRSQASRDLTSVVIRISKIKTNPCFRLDLPLTAFRLALPDSYLLDLGLDSGF